MREYTNLAWPETPFGADQRPFGKPSPTLTAVAVDWAHSTSGDLLPMATAAVYLRVRRASALTVAPGTLNIGFHVRVMTEPDDPGEIAGTLDTIDRTLVRARRHAAILAGHQLARDLDALTDHATGPLRGVAGVAEAWTDRSTKGRGMALMVDTADPDAYGYEHLATHSLDLPYGAKFPDTPSASDDAAFRALCRCLAVGLTAAVRHGRYRWEGAFDVRACAENAGWDCFPTLQSPTSEHDAD